MSVHDDLKSLHKLRDYHGICMLYDQFEDVLEINPSEWDFIYLMNGLYKNKRYEDCLTTYKACKRLYKECNSLNSKMGWCVYHIYLKGFDFSKHSSGDFFEKVDYVLGNIKDEPYSPVWCIVNLVTKVIVHKIAGNNPDYARANDYLELVKRTNLSREERRVETADGKSVSMASDYETWYSRKTKCLFKMGEWDECIKVCDEGISSITKFHNNNDSWFKYRKAVSMLKLGKFEKSMFVAEEILNSGFKHWSIYQLLYDIAVKRDDVSSAMKYAGCCALTDSKHEMRIKFYKICADFFYRQSMTEAAMLHLHLIVLIKQEQRWKLKEENQWKITDEISSMTKKETLQRLQSFWKKHRDKDKVYIEGRISRLLPSGKDGFVKDAAGEEYYFSFRDADCDRRKLLVGTRVMFVLGERLDKKRNIRKMNAIEIKLK